MPKIIHTRMERLDGETEATGRYGYTEYPITPAGSSRRSIASFYSIPPGKSNYPYHYHLGQEELFYIISGSGELQSPEGPRPVQAGDVLFFPAGEEGTHKLTNTSEAEPLVYLDVDAIADVDVAVYPESDKLGVWSETLNGTWRRRDRAPYYAGERDAE